MRLLIIAVLTALVLVSCTSQKKVMDSWINNTKQDLVLK